jgi:hypothetical protein
MRTATITLTLAVLAGVVGAHDFIYSVKVDSNGVLRTPLSFAASNDLATATAVNASNAVQDAAIAAQAATNAAQDSLIGAAVLTNAMGSGLTLTNGQWIVTSQGTVTNIAVNSKGGSVSNGIATALVDAADVGAMPTNTPLELWSNITEAATYPTNAILNGTTGTVSGDMIILTLPLGGYSTTGSVATVEQNLAAVSNVAAYASNTVAGLVADNTLTSVVAVASNAVGSGKSGRIGYVYVPTNAPGSDAALWSTNAAVQDVNMGGYALTNVSGLSVTGRLAIGFGVFQTTNDVPAPASTNTWIVCAVRQGGTN